MGDPMTPLTPADLVHPIALGEYLDTVDETELEGHDVSARAIANVYREPEGRYVHVLVASATKNVFLAIVVDEPARMILGHRLLDLRKKYGLR